MHAHHFINIKRCEAQVIKTKPSAMRTPNGSWKEEMNKEKLIIVVARAIEISKL